MTVKFLDKNHMSVVDEQNMITPDFLSLLDGSDISHELRTPLTAIRGFVELLLNSNDLNSAQRRNLQIILRNEARLESVIRKIEKVLGEFRKKSKTK